VIREMIPSISQTIIKTKHISWPQYAILLASEALPGSHGGPLLSAKNELFANVIPSYLIDISHVLDEIIPSCNESRSFIFNRIAWSMEAFRRLVEARKSSVTLPEALGRMRVHP
jgi:hypothetical protein